MRTRDPSGERQVSNRLRHDANISNIVKIIDNGDVAFSKWPIQLNVRVYYICESSWPVWSITYNKIMDGSVLVIQQALRCAKHENEIKKTYIATNYNELSRVHDLKIFAT